MLKEHVGLAFSLTLHPRQVGRACSPTPKKAAMIIAAFIQVTFS
jgi:hypothetical protein